MKITRMFPKVPAFVLSAAVACVLSSSNASAAIGWLFDFGTTNSTTGQPQTWNTVSLAVAGSATGSMLDVFETSGTQTTVDLFMISPFNGENMNGTTASTLYPSSATGDSFYGNTETFGNGPNYFPSFKFTSLTPGQAYSFKFYASRNGVSDNRTTDYTVSGSVSGTASLNVANNVNNFALVSDIFPTEGGEITISISPNALNSNSNHFTYLGVLEMQMVPEPATAMMLGFGALALGVRRRRVA